MGFKLNVPKVDLCSYPPYVVMGEPKSGKSTLARDLVIYNYGDESKGVLISFADEEGYLALDKLQFEKVVDWNAKEDESGLRGFCQVVDDLVENKEKYGIKMVTLDTYDKMVEVAINEVLKQSKRETGKPCKSINEAYGGFGRGRAKLTELLLEQIGRLRTAGYAVFLMAHTKWKEKTDALTGEKYEQLTNNLNSDYYGVISHIAQMIVNITIEREVIDGKQVGEKRLMYFRSNGIIDAGGRFTNLPECLPLSAENFMTAFEIGVKGSFLTQKTEKDLEELRKKEQEETKKVAEESLKKEIELKTKFSNDELCNVIKDKFPKANADVQSSVKQVMAQYEISNFKDPSSLSTEGLEKIVELFN